MRKIIVCMLIFGSMFGFAGRKTQFPERNGISRKDQIEQEKYTNNIIGIRVGYLYFSDYTNRQVYDDGALDIEIEDTWWYKPSYGLFSNAGFIWKSGQTAALSSSSSIDMLTWSIGVKESFQTLSDKLELYLGIGITTQFVWIKDSTDFADGNITRLSAGCVGKSGFLARINERGFLDVFFDYYYQPVSRANRTSTQSPNVDLGGFRTGAGFVWLF